MPYDPVSGQTTVAPGDGLTPPALQGQVGAQQLLFNGATDDREWNNAQGVLVPSAARTAAPAIATQTNPNHRGVFLFLNVTASPANASSTLTLSLLALDPVTGTATVPLLTPTALAATGVANAVTGLYVAQLYPALPVVAAMTKNGAPASGNGTLPRAWLASVVHATADSWTYSLSFSLVR